MPERMGRLFTLCFIALQSVQRWRKKCQDVFKCENKEVREKQMNMSPNLALSFLGFDLGK